MISKVVYTICMSAGGEDFDDRKRFRIFRLKEIAMQKNHHTIPAWSKDDRPREKFVLKGKNALSDAELLAILLGTGAGGKSAVDLGREALALTKGDLGEFGKLRLSQLCSVRGIGPGKAVTIMAALELGRRRRETEPRKSPKVQSSRDAYEVLMPYLVDLGHEESYLLLLNRNNKLIAVRQLSVGGAGGTVVDPKIIFKIAMDMEACAIIVAHNHPSGSTEPSEKDVLLTKKLTGFGDLIDMAILDHLIVSDNGYFSFSDNGMLR